MRDITQSVDFRSLPSVGKAIADELLPSFPRLDTDLLNDFLHRIEGAYWGRDPRWMACETPYHDLRHALDTALLMARMLDGDCALGRTPKISEEDALLAVVLGGLHDMGFLRRPDETVSHGAELARGHEQRSVDCARELLAGTALAHRAVDCPIILVTDFSTPTASFLADLPPPLDRVAQMLGAADLISQMSDRDYLERCRDFLYQELVIAGLDRRRHPNGQEELLYHSAEDILRQTPSFYRNWVEQRLHQDFGGCAQALDAHFGGTNPYHEHLRKNLAYLEGLIEQASFAGLRRHPQALIPNA